MHALKQVPSCEFFPMEAVKTNVMGTDNVVTVAVEMGVKKLFVFQQIKPLIQSTQWGFQRQ